MNETQLIDAITANQLPLIDCNEKYFSIWYRSINWCTIDKYDMRYDMTIVIDCSMIHQMQLVIEYIHFSVRYSLYLFL